MKFIAIILTMYISLLTVQPSANTCYSYMAEQSPENFCDGNCCKKEKSADDTCPTNKDCGMVICNPFMVCCNCCAVVSQKQTISVPVFSSDKKQFSIVSKNGCDFTAEAWNPPKTV